MAKITISDILAQFASAASINARLQQIEDELNDKVLYRANPVGEPNSMANDLDMAGNDLLNVGDLSGITAIVASKVIVTPVGDISSTDAQAALAELDSEKAKLAGSSAQSFSANGLTVAGSISVVGSVDGRSVSSDGTKLDGVEAAADVTDSTNVNAAGSIMHTDVAPTDGLLLKTGSEAYSTVKINSTASTNPSGADNFAAGYGVNSLWANISVGVEKSFICVGDGVWVEAGSATLSAITSITGSFPLTITGSATVPNVVNDLRGCSARTTDSSTFTANINTPIIWDGVDIYDTDAIHDPVVNNTRFTIPTGSSFAKVTGLISFSASTGVDISIRGDGTAPAIVGSKTVSGTATRQHNFATGWISVSGLTYLEVYAFTDTSRALDGSDTDNYLNIEFK